MHFPRRAGLLLHITSLPGGHGIGDLGSTAERFVDFLQASGLKIWQILPLGPTASGNSPYSSFSAFAGNPLLISLDRLAAQGLLTTADFADQPAFPTEHVDYGPVGSWKQAKLAIASDRFFARNDAHELDAFQKFAGENAWWLDDYALYMALARHHRTSDWSCWESGLVHRDPASIADWTAKLHDSVRLEKFVQYQFFKQWMELKRYANERGVDILGDLPIFVAYDSSDVWATQSAFCVDGEGRRTVVAGVPPDYFSVTGQLWGNPLYQWDYLASTGYDWWVKRLSHSLAMFDSVRIDHFRGFEAYWEVPGNALTAIDGRWVTGPGAAPFRAAEARGVPLRIVAEDLGMISDAVHALREELAFPGMRVFQFGYDDAEGKYHRPENYPQHSAAYTGTHDNDTIVGWFRARVERIQQEHRAPQDDFLFSWLSIDTPDVHWVMMDRVLSSAADTAIIPLQDVLGLGSEARMNIPGLADGNWGWRYQHDQLQPAVAERLRELVSRTGRA